MNDDKSDAHSGSKLYSNEEAEELLNCFLEKYKRDVSKHQRSVFGFVTIVISQTRNLRLEILRGNYNTVEPNSIVFPNGTIQVYISHECIPCGRKQLLYWCIKMLTDRQFYISNTRTSIIEISKDGKIISEVSAPRNRDMDESSFAMHYAKDILKRLF